MQVLAVGMTYIGKKLVERPLGQSVLRYALPLYFLSFWGCIGRLMQATTPIQISHQSRR